MVWKLLAHFVKPRISLNDVQCPQWPQMHKVRRAIMLRAQKLNHFTFLQHRVLARSFLPHHVLRELASKDLSVQGLITQTWKCTIYPNQAKFCAFSLVDFSLWLIKIQDGGSISQRVVRRFVQVAIQYTYSCIYVYRDNVYYTHKEQDKISRINFTERHFEMCASGLRYVEHLNTCILLHTCGRGSTIAFTWTFVFVFVFAFITL